MDLNKKYPYFERGEGLYLYDDQGKRYIDGAGGAIVVNVGHGLAEFAEVMRDQAAKLSFVFRLHMTNQPAQGLARKLREATGGHMDRSFFVNSGSEATEICVKLARKYHLDNSSSTKFKVISRWQSYHGITMGALSWSGQTKRRADYTPYLKDFGHIPPAYCYRCWFDMKPETCKLECATSLDDQIRCEGPETVSAFIAEPISGGNLSCVVPRDDYFRKIREICDRYDVLLIFDEVMTGFGRTGKLFGYEHFGIIPDLMALGKGISGGYFPLAAAMTSARVADTIAAHSDGFTPGHTYSAAPVGCALGIKTLEYLQENNLVASSAEMGKYLCQGLENLRKHPTVGDIRGKGLMIGLEFVKDQKTRETIDPKFSFSHKVHQEAFERGLIVLPSQGCNRGQSGDTILLGPPFIITRGQIDELVGILDDTLSAVEQRYGFQ